jgi:hypothetical protein
VGGKRCRLPLARKKAFNGTSVQNCAKDTSLSVVFVIAQSEQTIPSPAGGIQNKTEEADEHP